MHGSLLFLLVAQLYTMSSSMPTNDARRPSLTILRSPSVSAAPSRQVSSTLPPIVIRYRIAHKGSSAQVSSTVPQPTEFWGFDRPSLKFRDADANMEKDKPTKAEETLLDDDDTTLTATTSATFDDFGKKPPTTENEDGKKQSTETDIEDPPTTTDNPLINETSDPVFKVFPYLLVGKTETGEEFPFIAMMRHQTEDKDIDLTTKEPFVPAFIALEPEQPKFEAPPQPQVQPVIAAPVLNLPTSMREMVMQAALDTMEQPRSPPNFLRFHPMDEDASFFHPQFVPPGQFQPFRRVPFP